MPIKKQRPNAVQQNTNNAIAVTDDELKIYDEAIIFKRGNYWQMRMWLQNEHRYARFSLRTKNRDTAIDKAKKQYYTLMSLMLAGKTYYSKTTKNGVEMYLKQRATDVEAGLIVKGRLSTITIHLMHFLNFIGRNVKLKQLERTDCENYFYARTKTKKRQITISQTTIENEQSTINAMISWLYKRGETKIDGFDFKKLKRIDKGLEANRRSTFTDDEISNIIAAIELYTKNAERDLTNKNNLIKAIAGYYLGVSIATGVRRGEQMQLRWDDIEELSDNSSRLIKITVRGETSKVRKTRKFVIKDKGNYFNKLIALTRLRHTDKSTATDAAYGKFLKAKNEYIFSLNGCNLITTRMISYHFDKVISLAAIQNVSTRDLTPYSFRHYFITGKFQASCRLDVKY
jgi:integrase